MHDIAPITCQWYWAFNEAYNAIGSHSDIGLFSTVTFLLSIFCEKGEGGGGVGERERVADRQTDIYPFSVCERERGVEKEKDRDR